ncbi:hypothetical protein J2X14_000870 [Pantoea alhagi]|uniref:hypothetical protein n=1 Tax=Mixta sp. BE291 TaxID=3158787 RepID=UPI00285AE0EB|nr:hypothetical protein [Pantoea alhagi]
MLSRSNSQYGMENIAKTGDLLRSYSFSKGDNYSFYNDLNGINNSPLGLRRSKAVSNLALSDGSDKDCGHIRLEYNNCNIKDISAKDYVSCAMVSTLPINNLGMSIDKDGHLVLIKGKSHNFIKGVIKKYTTGYTYKVSKLSQNNADKKFQDLYIDDNGLLIGNEKDTGKSYVINISIPEIVNHNSEQLIELDFEDYHPQIRHDDLTFKVDEDYTVSYFVKENKLYLKTIEKGESVKDYSFFLFEINMQLSSKQVISSIKRVNGILQVEIKSEEKRRIFYIDPKHISHRDLSVRKMSHKPPQIFSSRLGNDPHEKYHAGLPFTSDRAGNFSSEYIPLVSTIIDNIRGKIKKGKQASAEGDCKEMAKNFAKVLDPVFESSIKSSKGLSRSAQTGSGKNINDKNELCTNSREKIMTRAKPLSKLIDEAVGVKAEKEFSKSLIRLVDNIKTRETVHLTSADRIAAFFGIGSGGLPFMPGWFAGIVMELSERYNLSIAKTETGNIKVAFNHRKSKALTALAGTGQGLERSLLNANSVDYMTVMPFEANAIITMQSAFGSNFSFELSEEHFKDFAEQFCNLEESSTFNDMFVDEAEAEKIKEKGLVVKVEAKSELRLQAGTMVNPNTYMVMPRTAVGGRLAMDLLNVKSSSSESVGKNEKVFASPNDTLKITTLNHEAALFAEWKVMPIAMHGGGDDILWCYPLPLLEEGKTLAEYKNDKGVTIYSKGEENKPSANLTQGFIRVNNIADVAHTPMFIKVNDKKGARKGVALKRIATVDKEMTVVNSILAELKSALKRQERSSQNKSCVIEVVSHYEPIATLSHSSDATDNNEADASTATAEKNDAYRLKKLEFRRNSSLQHKTASVPLPLLNFSTVHAISYDQLLGEIEFQYQNESDLSPVKTKRKMNILY